MDAADRALRDRLRGETRARLLRNSEMGRLTQARGGDRVRLTIGTRRPTIRVVGRHPHVGERRIRDDIASGIQV